MCRVQYILDSHNYAFISSADIMDAATHINDTSHGPHFKSIMLQCRLRQCRQKQHKETIAAATIEGACCRRPIEQCLEG